MKKQMIAAGVAMVMTTACTTTEETNSPDNTPDNEADDPEEPQNDEEQDSNMLASETDGDFQLDVYQAEEEPEVFRAELRYTGSEEEMEIFHYQNVINFHLEQDGEVVGGAPFVDDGNEYTSTTLEENESIEDSVSRDTIDNYEPASGEAYMLVAEPFFNTEEDLEEEEAVTTPRVEVEVTFSN
ncbi:hypothetical protein [Alkalicoccus chagannorensis]|uniref:hypothetical protein n=1 Tax=Alkalicoccus chagannorensis TaxID=427072 RepID=UPI00041EC0E2|nr:hypothetical protein [Alkalicoccus chagannorensis]